MAKFEFPKNPGTQRETPFKDSLGENPFSDGTAQSTDAIKEDLFEGPADSAERPYLPSDYESVLVPNPEGAWRLAVAGLVLSGLGVVGAGIAIVGSGNWIMPLFFILPLQFAGLAIAAPACIIARRDLRAIKAGAMSDAGRRKSRLALWLGACAGLLGSFPVVIYFALLIASALSC